MIADGQKDNLVRRVCCLSPNRSILDGLAPTLARCLPGASVTDVRSYPAEDQLLHAFDGATPELCFIDAISDRSKALGLIQAILRLETRTAIIVLLAADEPDLILKCLRVGASEFLMHPYNAEDLQAALSKLKITPAGPDQTKQAKVFCVIPAKGACGATTVACNLANYWKRLSSRRILLADMDPLTGSVAFLLKLQSGYSFLDVLNRVDTLDADLWKGMVTTRDGIDMLLAPELLVQGISDARDATPIVEFARKNYEIVILDASSAYGEWNLSQARASDEILLVTTNELPALLGAQRSVSYLEANRIPKWKVRVIVNRYNNEVGLGKDVVASALHIDVLQTIPSDYEAVQKALLDGKCIAPNTPLGRTFSQLVDRLAGCEKEAPPRTAPLGGLLSLFFRTS